MGSKRDDWQEGFRGSGWNRYSPGYRSGALWRRALTFNGGISAGKGSAGAGLGILLVIGVLLVISHRDGARSPAEDDAITDAPQATAASPQGQPAQEGASSSTSQPLSAPQSPSQSADANAQPSVDSNAQAKPSPYASAYAYLNAPDEGKSSTTADAPGQPVVFTATHKEGWGGGCRGQLSLSNTGLQFICPNQADLNFPLGLIRGADKDGIVLWSGKKYHFKIEGMNAEAVNFQFRSWLYHASNAPPATTPAN